MSPDYPEYVALEEAECLRIEEARTKKFIIFGATYVNTKLCGTSRHVKTKIVIRVEVKKGETIVVYKWGLRQIRRATTKNFLNNYELVRMPTCAVPGCHRIKATKLLCNAHLLRLRSGKGLQIDNSIGKVKRTRRVCDLPQSLPALLPG